jgi:hypothetical protein
MLDKLLIISARSTVNKVSVSYLHLFRKEGVDLYPVVGTVNLLFFETLIHLIVLNLIIQSLYHILELIICLLQRSLL